MIQQAAVDELKAREHATQTFNECIAQDQSIRDGAEITKMVGIHAKVGASCPIFLP